MRHYIITIFYILFIHYTSVGANTEQDIYFYHLTPKDGLSQMSILSIYQDEFGAMWFGTTEGLDRYNGSNIESFKPSETEHITNNTIQYVTGNKKGALYLITGNDLVRFDLKTYKIELIKEKVDAIKYDGNQLWISKGDSLFVYNERKRTFDLQLITDHKTEKTSTLLIDEKNILVGTNKHLYKIDRTKKNEVKTLIENDDISYLFRDYNDNLWVGTKSNGIYIIGSDGSIREERFDLNKNSLSDNQIRSITEDNLGNIWVATFYGLNRYDIRHNGWQSYMHDNRKPYSLSHSSVFALYNDQQGTMWIGTYFGGVNYFNVESDSFRFYGASLLNMNSISFPYVGNMIEDSKGNLWICTEGGQLNCLNLSTGELSKYKLRQDNKPSERYNQKSIWYNREKDKLYIGIHNGGLSIFDIKTKQTQVIENVYPIDESIKNNSKSVNHMEYYDNHLVLMTSSGLIKMDMETEVFSNFSNRIDLEQEISKAKRLTFHIDQKKRLWLISNGITYIDLDSNEIVRFKHDPLDPHSIGKCEINHIYESKSGNLYFSSMGSGVFRFNEKDRNFDNFNAKDDGLISDFCYSISETPSGNLILLHNKGISFINPKKSTLNTFRTSSNFPIQGFNIGNSIYTASNNEIFIGGVNGLIAFFEEKIGQNDQNYNIYFDKLYINNRAVKPLDENKVLEEVLPLSKIIRLNADQNNFGIDFATNSYKQTIVRSYEYKLEGFDKKWIQTNTRSISYTNLNPGRYILKIREIGDNEKQAELKIEIARPFYSSNVSYSLYFVVLIIIVYLIVRFLKWRTRLEESLKFEHLENKRIEELNQMKLRFFTNVSHEFRTPLTLIINYVETLLTETDLPQSIRKKVDKIARNTNHLLNLINELLDFRKQEQGFYKLKVEKIDFDSYIRNIYDTFKDYVTAKNIGFKLNSSLTNIYVYLDSEYFKKAIYNLLSNAFKYTPEGGSIEINIKQTRNNGITLEFKDTGIGISEQYLDKIFDRFYQVEHRPSEVNYGTGTGIGLALTKEIVKSHHGTISVNSIVGVGSTFCITLQLGNKHFDNDQLVNDSLNSVSPTKAESTNDIIYHDNTTKTKDFQNREATDQTKPTLLIADDNASIVDIIAESLSNQYHVLKAYNGADGYKIATKEMVDIIISDNIMPEFSGKELCYKIKNNILTSHIPFILLTAETSENQIAEGYLFGADAYITKPFKMKVLASVCNNLIRNRQLLYKKFRDETGISTQTEYALNNNDFVEKVINIIKKNLSNPDFDMNKLGVELGYGRSKLYVKIKEQTGMTPNELTLNIKLKEAVYQLENNLQKNISQIAFELGFSSTKYFSKCFKSFYGITPQDWRKKQIFKIEEGV